jgi:3'-phosphoadenosine 5'-phosphosulfate sulfotransferase (PAPS reductase)/FAD synthetase
MKSSKKHFASISFGADSTCMFLMLIEKKYPLDEVVFYNHGVEFQAIYKVRDLLVPYMKTLGIKFTEIHPEKPFFWNMLERPVCKRGTNIVHKYGYSWCGGTCRWGTSMKLTALKKHTKDGWDYVGLAANETYRFQRENRPNRLLPLNDWGVTEKEALEYCYSMGIYWEENGLRLYDLLDRVSCWCCGNKNLKELKNMYLYMPEYWKNLKLLQEKTSYPFRRNDKQTIHDLERRFQRETNINTLFPTPISLGKGNSAPVVLQGYTSFEKNLRASLRSGSIFSKNLAGQRTRN